VTRPPPALVLAALRNYASGAFVRDNAMIYSAGYNLVAAIVILGLSQHEVARHGLPALLDGHSGLRLLFWWLAAWSVPAAISLHYWRQIRATLAPLVPGLVEVELAAVIIVLALSLLLLAAPLWWLGAPVFGTLALAAIGMAMGGGIGTSYPTGATRRMGRLRALLIVPLIGLALLPHLMSRVIFAPWWAALALLVVAAGLVVSGLRYFPARAALQADIAAHAADRPRPPPRPLAARLIAVISWRPAFMPESPLNLGHVYSFGPVGALLASFFMVFFLVTFMGAFGMFDGRGFAQVIHDQGGQSIGQAVGVTLVVAGQWLLNRGDWPLLFAAGRYGSRAGFARRMFRAHLIDTLQRATADAIAGAAIGGLFHIFQPWQCLPAAFIIFGLVFGASYANAIPLFWREFGGKGVAVGLRMAGYFLIVVTFSLALTLKHGFLIAGAVSALTFIAGLATARFAPARLAAMDWPYEAEPVAV